MALTVLELLKHLPRTNCGECGQTTCLAFATQVIKEGENLARCPFLPEALQDASGEIRRQQEQGVGRRRESLAIALEALQAKIAPLDFAGIAAGLGAHYRKEDQREYLALTYFGQELKVFKEGIVYPPGAEANPWDAILLYNYLASQGKALPTGKWIRYHELPNSVSKAKTLARLEKQLADHFQTQPTLLSARGAKLGGQPVQTAADATLQLEFWPLPRVPLRLLFWEAETEDDFPAQAHFLFDAQVSDFLDLESLLFLVEQLVGRLLSAK